MTNKLLLITRSTPACPNCLAMKAALETEGVEYEEVDIAIDEEATDKFDVMSLPTSIVQDADGNEVFRTTGVRPPELIKEVLA